MRTYEILGLTLEHRNIEWCWVLRTNNLHPNENIVAFNERICQDPVYSLYPVDYLKFPFHLLFVVYSRPQNIFNLYYLKPILIRIILMFVLMHFVCVSGAIFFELWIVKFTSCKLEWGPFFSFKYFVVGFNSNRTKASPNAECDGIYFNSILINFVAFEISSCTYILQRTRWEIHLFVDNTVFSSYALQTLRFDVK